MRGPCGGLREARVARASEAEDAKRHIQDIQVARNIRRSSSASFCEAEEDTVLRAVLKFPECRLKKRDNLRMDCRMKTAEPPGQ